MDATLTQLRYLVAVDTHRHFGHAARACHVTQPTLSMQLAKLERTLGATLFDRSRTPVVPTEVGALVIEQARVVLGEAARFTEIVGTRAGVVAGQLRLGVIPTLAPYLLPRVVHVLTRRHPALELVIEERITDELVQAVRRDQLDAAIVASTVVAPGLEERPLFSEPFVGYLSTGHRLARRRTISRTDLSLDDLWLLSEGHCFRDQTLQLCGQRTSRHSRGARAYTLGARFESGNLETLKRLVERGEGMTLLPALAAMDLQTAADRRRVRHFSSPAPSRDVRLVRRRGDLKRDLVQAVVAALLAALPDELRPSAPARSR